MTQQTTNRLLIAGLGVVALLLVGSNFYPSKKNDTASATRARAAEPTTASMRQKILQTGWQSCTLQEKAWLRDHFITALSRIDCALTFRYRSAQIRGLRQISAEISNAQGLIRAEATRIESDPDADPTTAQILINQVTEALNKP